jgi:site-specific DNA-methyltransferase (adenine-specific)
VQDAYAWKNKLYFGDNLEILRNHIPDESVDLIYLDPPFNSNATYNVLFAEKSGEKSAAQITAFEDTWHWSIESEKSFHETVTEGPQKLSDLLQALRSFLGQNDMMAYLTMMAPRLVEMHRVLKHTGSLYLHCDPTASHYLKIVLDAVFGQQNFVNEIIWRRAFAHNDSGRCGRIHDTILFYAKSERRTWNRVLHAPNREYIETFFDGYDEKRKERYQRISLSAGGLSGGGYDYEYKGVRANWRCPLSTLEQHDREGRLHWPKKGVPRLKRFESEYEGTVIQDIWTDINKIHNQSAELLGYPTQKPEALLERIIKASSNEGDIILDPFCGCGTAIATAERLHRHWMGIDITHLAITLMRHRLRHAFGSELSEYEVIGVPKDLTSAAALAQQDCYQFEWWALDLVDARPAHDKKKGADSGIDGYINFFDDYSSKAKRIIVQVKSGHVSSSQVRDLKGVLEREKAAIGAFVTLKKPTRDMIKEAASAGFYEATHYAGREYPRLQIVTIEELLSGKKLLYPALKEVTFKQAERKSKRRDKQDVLFKAG